MRDGGRVNRNFREFWGVLHEAPWVLHAPLRNPLRCSLVHFHTRSTQDDMSTAMSTARAKRAALSTVAEKVTCTGRPRGSSSCSHSLARSIGPCGPCPPSPPFAACPPSEPPRVRTGRALGAGRGDLGRGLGHSRKWERLALGLRVAIVCTCIHSRSAPRLWVSWGQGAGACAGQGVGAPSQANVWGRAGPCGGCTFLGGRPRRCEHP